MGAFNKLELKTKKIRMTIEIENDLYDKLTEMSQNTYDISVNGLINLAIAELIKTENIENYKKINKNSSVKHSLLIKEPLVNGLEALKEKSDIAIYRLVNIAIQNAINELENKDKH